MAENYVPAKHFKSTSGRQIDLIVIHDMEAPERPNTAENIANYFATSSRVASAHWNFDSDSAIRSVQDKNVAYHAPGANHNGLGYEHAGYARQTREEWLDEYSIAMLKISAYQASIDCAKYSLPVNYVDVNGLLQGRRGITTHWDVSRAFRRSTHWDPGPNFPMEIYLDLVRGIPVQASQTSNPVASTTFILRRGDMGLAVRDWQTLLHGAGLLSKDGIDGVFGPNTENATRQWQRTIGVPDDGIVGPITNEATARVLAWIAGTQIKPPQFIAPVFPGTVKKGSRGHNVSAVQDRLRERGWNISVDGVFGSQTDQIVRSFQREKGLVVDGIVGPATWIALWTSPIT